MGHVAGSTGGGSHTSWDVLAEHCELFVAFGGLPLKNAQSTYNGAGRHRVRGGVRRMREAGVRIVNIGPVGDNLGEGDAGEWIPIRPNTDTAMMLALAWVGCCTTRASTAASSTATPSASTASAPI